MWSTEQVVALRRAFGETQEQFARRLRMSIDGLRNWEQGRIAVPPSMSKLLDYVEEHELPEHVNTNGKNGTHKNGKAVPA